MKTLKSPSFLKLFFCESLSSACTALLRVCPGAVARMGFIWASTTAHACCLFKMMNFFSRGGLSSATDPEWESIHSQTALQIQGYCQLSVPRRVRAERASHSPVQSWQNMGSSRARLWAGWVTLQDTPGCCCLLSEATSGFPFPACSDCSKEKAEGVPFTYDSFLTQELSQVEGSAVSGICAFLPCLLQSVVHKLFHFW